MIFENGLNLLPVRFGDILLKFFELERNVQVAGGLHTRKFCG